MKHTLFADSPEQVSHELAWCWDANEDFVNAVLNAEVDTGEGRSQWYWIRLPNGDLLLGTFPQGATYEMIAESGEVE